ncbi:MAG: Gfo/Idh/MocA family oxidoreductase [Planctomycetes bacterium]|nr:Gfo/Idh/MocA family oxidoreductase [Planctomycetota bacterium]
MPKAIPVAVITNRDGTHLDQWIPSLAAIEEVESVTLVDSSGASVAAARKALGNKLRAVHKDGAEMYRRFRPTLSVISLEPRLCPAAIDAALDAGAHVLSEKPGCTRVEDFSPLLRKAQQRHKHLMLVMANRSHAPVQEARRLIRKGQLGQIYGIEIHIVADQTRLTQRAYRESWQCIRERGGGGHLAWFGIMWLDLAMYITGLRVEAVAGFHGVVGGQPIDVEDAAVLALKFNRRCFGTMTSAYYLDRGVQSHIQIWGQHGWLKLATVEEQPMQYYTTRVGAGQEPRVQEYAYPRGQRGYTPFLRSAVRACAGLEDPPMTGDECLALLRTVYGFYQSAQTERVQRLT